MGMNGRTLWTGVMKTPDYSISWDGRDYGGKSVAPGAYFVKVSGKYRNHIKKFILQK
jgi:flagellar hook assembly protein FlgD